MIVSGEQSSYAASGPARQFFHYGPGQGQAVEGAGAPPYFVQNDQAALGGLAQDAGGFHHFHHKGALPLGQVVRRPHPRKHAVHQAHFRLGGGNE